MRISYGRISGFQKSVSVYLLLHIGALLPSSSGLEIRLCCHCSIFHLRSTSVDPASILAKLCVNTGRKYVRLITQLATHGQSCLVAAAPGEAIIGDCMIGTI